MGGAERDPGGGGGGGSRRVRRGDDALEDGRDGVGTVRVGERLGVRLQATGSILPVRSTSFTPLSGSGLREAVMTMPVARPVTWGSAAASAPQRNTVDARTSPLVRKPAVP